MTNPTLTSDLNQVIESADAAQKAGRWMDALAMYDAVIRDSSAGAEMRAQLLRKVGQLHFYRGEFEMAREMFEASCQAARMCGAWAQLASALNCLANVEQSTGRLDAAEALFKQALLLAEQSGHGRLAVMIDQNLGTIASIRGDYTAAFGRYCTVLERYETSNDQQGAAWVLNNLGMVHTESERWEEARKCFERALGLADERGDSEMVGTVQLNLAAMNHRAKNFEEARTSADRAFSIFTRLDSKQGLGEVAKLYGMLYRDSGKMALAEAYLHVVIETARANDFMLLEAEAEAEFALVHQSAGRSRDALRSLNASHRLFGELKAQHRLLDVEKQLDKLEQKYLLVTKVWGESIESKDHYTAGHCSRVAEYACKLAEASGYRGRDITWIRMGGFLHDVGKTAVDPHILTKPGKLDAREWEAMKKHTTVGDAIVSEMDFPWDIRPMVRNHHEHWDGRGYPDGLAGTDVPLTARILCVADVYDALTTTRSYRPLRTPYEALQIMREESGQTLDPELFRVFETRVWPQLTALQNAAPVAE